MAPPPLIVLVGGGPRILPDGEAADLDLRVTDAPLTAPAPLDPRPPVGTTVVRVVAELGAIGRVVADRCHRPLRVAALAGCSPYRRLTAAAMATALTHPAGFLALVPPGATSELLLLADTDADLEPFLRIAVPLCATAIRKKDAGP